MPRGFYNRALQGPQKNIFSLHSLSVRWRWATVASAAFSFPHGHHAGVNQFRRVLGGPFALRPMAQNCCASKFPAASTLIPRSVL